MSDSAAVCRLCLAVDVRLLAITGSLQQVYERISDNYLYTADERPVSACYVCHAQLLKCRRLMLTSARAENVLNAIVYSNSQITVHSVSAMDRQANGLCWPLIFSGPECFGTAPAAPEVTPEIESGSIDVEDIKSEGNLVVSAIINDSECEDEYDPISLVQPYETEIEIKEEGQIDIKEEGDVGEDFPQPIHVTVSVVKDEDSGSDADDNSLLKSLRAETPVEGELRDDGASDQISAEKRKLADGRETNWNQQLTGEYTTEQSGHKCNVCQRLFKFQSHLKIHLVSHTREKPHECYLCHSRFGYRSSLNSHLKMHTQEQKLTSRTTEKPYICSVCKKRFSNQSSLNQHFKTHTGEKLYECDVCQHRFDRSSNLTNHLRTHSGEKLFHCNMCEYKFKEKSSLSRHLKIHSGEKRFECRVCQQRFYRKWNLDLHFRTHTGEKPFQCSVCGSQFRQSTSLQFHMRTHTGEKPYKCDVCQRKFSRLHHYLGHLDTHEKRNRRIVDKTSLEVEEANECNRRFSESDLGIEERQQTGNRRIVDKISLEVEEANECSRRFSESDLGIEERQQTGSEPYECEHCELRFSHEAFLQSHLRTHGKDPPEYKCDICQSRFKLKVAFRRHVIDSHWC